jgi:hypothetical protein
VDATGTDGANAVAMATVESFSARGYQWDAPLKSVADLEEPAPRDRTRDTERGTATSSTAGGPGTQDWHARYLDLASRFAAIVDAIPTAAERGARGPAFQLLRRMVGGLATVLDALHRLPANALSVAPPAIRQYLECAHWWFSRLLGDLRDALAGPPDARSIDERIVAAAEFAALYGLSHVARLHDDVERLPKTAMREDCLLVQGEVAWLTWQLKDLADS